MDNAHCILIVDDDQRNREMLAEALRQANFHVDLASSGAHSRIPRSTFFIGIGTPIRPVEQTKTSRAVSPL